MKYYLAKFNLSTYYNTRNQVSVVQSVENRLIEAANAQEAEAKLVKHFKDNGDEAIWYTLHSIDVYEQI